MYSLAAPELTSLRSMASDLAMMRATRRPMRPKPLMPPATAMVGAWAAARGRGRREGIARRRERRGAGGEEGGGGVLHFGMCFGIGGASSARLHLFRCYKEQLPQPL